MNIFVLHLLEYSWTCSQIRLSCFAQHILGIDKLIFVLLVLTLLKLCINSNDSYVQIISVYIWWLNWMFLNKYEKVYFFGYFNDCKVFKSVRIWLSHFISMKQYKFYHFQDEFSSIVIYKYNNLCQLKIGKNITIFSTIS